MSGALRSPFASWLFLIKTGRPFGPPLTPPEMVLTAADRPLPPVDATGIWIHDALTVLFFLSLCVFLLHSRTGAITGGVPDV